MDADQSAELSSAVRALKAEKQKAIEEEDYKTAARLKKRIHVLEAALVEKLGEKANVGFAGESPACESAEAPDHSRENPPRRRMVWSEMLSQRPAASAGSVGSEAPAAQKQGTEPELAPSQQDTSKEYAAATPSASSRSPYRCVPVTAGSKVDYSRSNVMSAYFDLDDWHEASQEDDCQDENAAKEEGPAGTEASGKTGLQYAQYVPRGNRSFGGHGNVSGLHDLDGWQECFEPEGVSCTPEQDNFLETSDKEPEQDLQTGEADAACPCEQDIDVKADKISAASVEMDTDAQKAAGKTRARAKAGTLSNAEKLRRLARGIRQAGQEEDTEKLSRLLRRRCELLRMEGQLGRALVDAEAWAELRPEDPEALFRRGVARLEAGGHDAEALRDLYASQRLGLEVTGKRHIDLWIRRARHWITVRDRPNHYLVLAVQADAPVDRVKQAYRQAVLRWHPDKPGGDAEHFRAVQAAWEVLGKKETRQLYDFGTVAPVRQTYHRPESRFNPHFFPGSSA